MRASVDEHVPEVAGVLALVSLALVFGAVLQVLPVESLPRVEPLLALVPHLNAAISVAAVTVIAVGWRAIRRGDVRRHRRAMLSGFLFFGAFLGLYLYKVALTGPTPFDGPGWVAAYVYYPILGVHVLLAMVCVPLLFSVLLLALTRPVAEIPLTEHPRIGRITAALWLSSFVLGTIVYAKLYLIY